MTVNLGMHVLRHEEFNQGCEATCNGPYARPWSKTMIGFGSEQETFVFELTYNYGVHKYEKGNDLRHVSVVMPLEWSPNNEWPYTVSGDKYIISGPDNVEWHVTKKANMRHVENVSINVASLGLAKQFYTETLGLTVASETEGAVQLCWRDEDLTRLEIAQLVGFVSVEHAAAFGRVAFACPSVPLIEAKVKAANSVIKHGPVKLDTPGKATVEVIIVEDIDGYEICFVEVTGFDELSKPSPGSEVIDWNARSELGADKA